MLFKNYVRISIFVWLAVLLVGASATVVYRLEPLHGDLTRLGWKSEYLFGPNISESYFENAISKRATLGDYYDVVVIGDSFSNTEPFASLWHNYLSENTGLSVGVFHLSQLDLCTYLKSKEFSETPPLFLIYQTVERAMKSRLSNPMCVGASVATYQGDVVKKTVASTQVQSISHSRDKNPYINIGYGLKFYYRQLFPTKDVVVQEMTVTDLFSNRHSDKILFYKDDLLKKSWTATDWKEMSRTLFSLGQIVEANAYTKFIPLVANDKSSAYRAFIEHTNTSIYENLEFFREDNYEILEVSRFVEDSIKSGAVDFYNPNNTHWSASGNRLVGAKVSSLLVK